MSHLGLKNTTISTLIAVVSFSFALATFAAERIVTVGGAATEIVFALGSGDEVVAVDLSSTYPAAVRQLPQVGYIRNISPEGILSMKPDVVVATDSLGPVAAKDVMKKIDLPVVWLPEPDSYEALKTSVNRVAKKLNKPDEAAAILAEVQAQLKAAQANAATWSNKSPRVLFFLNPPSMSRAGQAGGAETRADSLIDLAGGENAASSFEGFREISAESIIGMNPDVILVSLSPGHGGTPESVEALKESQALASVSAVKNGHVYGVPLDDINFGPRLGEAALRWNALLAKQANTPTMGSY